MKKKISLFLFFTLLTAHAFSQFFSFSSYENVEVFQNGEAIANPWTGSYNSGQFWPCDVNNDGQDDLVVFDKTSDRVLTYLAKVENGKSIWEYNTDYEHLLPPLENWIATADFNCDGKKDLFTSTAAGIKVYRNISAVPGQVAFTLEVDGLTSQGFSGQINLQVNAYGAPAIADIDGDGDLDILAFEFSGGSIVEYHKNMVYENTGQCAGFQLKKELCAFGLFSTTPVCGQIRLNTGCFGQKAGGRNIPMQTARIQHVGSQLSAIDFDGDGDKDLLVGDLHCSLLNRLTNGGSPESALITSADTLFPNQSNRVKINTFPSVYQMDVNFDGKLDILGSPTFFNNKSEDYSINTSKGTHLYLDQSSGNIPNYEFSKTDYLQNESIDVGAESTPAFADVDGDGNQDMFIGNQGERTGALVQAKIAFYKNTGTTIQPKFELVSSDFLGISSLNRKTLRPIFEDFNNDGSLDFGWISSLGKNSDTSKIHFLLNQATVNQPFVFPPLNQAIAFPFIFSDYDCPLFADIDGDNKKDLLIGKYFGKIQYWRQTNSWPSLTYQLIDNNYGSIYNISSNCSLAMADIDKDSNLDLIVGDYSGKLKIYRNFKLNANNRFLADSTWFENSVLNQKLFRTWGNFVSPSTADLNGDGYPELAIGTQGGGISLLVNRLGISSISKTENEPLWRIFPNPIQKGISLKWNVANIEKIEIYDLQGKQIFFRFGHELEKTNELEIPSSLHGLYYVKLRSKKQLQILPLLVD